MSHRIMVIIYWGWASPDPTTAGPSLTGPKSCLVNLSLFLHSAHSTFNSAFQVQLVIILERKQILHWNLQNIWS